jgi:hypothetical protein
MCASGLEADWMLTESGVEVLRSHLVVGWKRNGSRLEADWKRGGRIKKSLNGRVEAGWKDLETFQWLSGSEVEGFRNLPRRGGKDLGSFQ